MNAKIFLDYSAGAYMYVSFTSKDTNDMRMLDAKCKHNPGFYVNVSLVPKSIVGVVIHHSMHSIMKLILQHEPDFITYCAL